MIFDFGKWRISGEGLDDAIADFWEMHDQLGEACLFGSLGVSDIFDAMAKWCQIRRLDVTSLRRLG